MFELIIIFLQECSCDNLVILHSKTERRICVNVLLTFCDISLNVFDVLLTAFTEIFMLLVFI